MRSEWLCWAINSQSVILSRAVRELTHARTLRSNMAIKTEPTQLDTAQLRRESIHESQVTARMPRRPSASPSRDSSVTTLSAERTTARLRAPSIHDPVTADKPLEPARKFSPAEFNTA